MLIKASSIDPKYINLYSLHNKTIVIPIFQRFYDWKEKQVDALLEDLLNCKDDFSKGWDCGYKCGKESIERNENYWHEN